MHMKLVGLILALLFPLLLFGQVEPAYHFAFEQCAFQERNGDLSDMVASGMITCECGPENDAVVFDGNSSLEMEVPGNLLQRNFSLSFYLNPPVNGTQQLLMSNAANCTQRDSLFEIRYFPSVNTISFQIADFGGLRALMEAPLDENKCWQNVIIVKDGRILRLYINGELAETFEGDQPIDIESNDPLLIGASRCAMGQGPDNYNGQLDELKWFDRALNPLEILQVYTPMDEILTSDTLLFLGDAFTPTFSSTCAQSIMWSPGTGLSSTSVIDPIISPTQTTRYGISFNYVACSAQDSLQVTVIDPNAIDCDNLLLPTAFTPNGDNLNDTYFISNGYIVESLAAFQIMDRSGNTLWEAQNANDVWDGTYRGQLVSSGSYAYQIVYTCGGEEKVRVGSFNVIR